MDAVSGSEVLCQLLFFKVMLVIAHLPFWLVHKEFKKSQSMVLSPPLLLIPFWRSLTWTDILLSNLCVVLRFLRKTEFLFSFASSGQNLLLCWLEQFKLQKNLFFSLPFFIRLVNSFKGISKLLLQLRHANSFVFIAAVYHSSTEHVKSTEH